MNSTIVPVMALNLMSCTEPVLPYENNTNISNDENDKNLYEKYNTKNEYNNDFKSKSIIIEIYDLNDNNKMKNYVKIPNKFKQNRNNKYRRKIHNIHQPGRTNCTQRLYK